MNTQIATNAGIEQDKILNFAQDPNGWLSKGIIKPVVTSTLPIWDGSQSGQLYYDTNTNELYIGLTTQPYYQLLAGTGVNTSGGTDRLLVVLAGSDAVDWNGTTGSIYAIGTGAGVASDGSNLSVYLNGALQQMGSGADFILISPTGVEEIQFNYNISNPNDKITLLVNTDSTLVNYATKAWVNNLLTSSPALQFNGIDAAQLDFNVAISASSLGNIIHSVVPNSTAVNLGSSLNSYGNVYAIAMTTGQITVGGNLVVSSSGATLATSLSVSGNVTANNITAGQNLNVSGTASFASLPVILSGSRVVSCLSGTSFPTSPGFGDEFFHSDTKVWWKYDGAEWGQI